MYQTILIAVLAVAVVAAIVVVRRVARGVLTSARQQAAEIERDAENHSRIRLKEVELEAEEHKAAAEAQF